MSDKGPLIRRQTAFTTIKAGARGRFAFRAHAEPVLSGQPPGRTVLKATDRRTGATATATFWTVERGVSVKPSRVARPARTRVNYAFFGFTPGEHIYAYYQLLNTANPLRLQSKRIWAVDQFPKASGACGTLYSKALLYPGGLPRGWDPTAPFASERDFKVSFENSPRYSFHAAKFFGEVDLEPYFEALGSDFTPMSTNF